METEALTLLADQDGYDKYYQAVNKNRQFFVEPAQQAVKHLKEYRGINTAPTVSWQDYETWLLLTKLPQLDEEDKGLYKKFFAELKAHKPDEKVQANIISTLMERKAAEDIIEAAEAISGGDGRFGIEDIEKALEAYKESVQIDMEDVRVVSSDLDELLGAVLGDGLDWKQMWMNQSCGPLRKGDFVALVARPDSGKTSWLSGQANSFAKQTDKPILWINNEQEGRKVKLRIVQEAVGMSNVDMNLHKDKVKEQYQNIVGSVDAVVVIDKAGITAQEIEVLCKQYDPGAIIIDQLWKVKGLGSEQESVGTQTAVANWARELCKVYAPVIGVYQAGDTATGKKYFGYDAIYLSKTAVAGEADLIVCMGRSQEEGEQNNRYFNFPKNKMAGGGPYFDARTTDYRHESLFNPETGEFK